MMGTEKEARKGNIGKSWYIHRSMKSPKMASPMIWIWFKCSSMISCVGGLVLNVVVLRGGMEPVRVEN